MTRYPDHQWGEHPGSRNSANLFRPLLIITLMAIEILDFSQSLLNPFLKALVTVIFAAGTVLFYQAYLRYGGNLKKIAFYLVISGIVGTLAAAFRWMGDLFNQWKWGESSFLLLFAIVSILVSFVVYSYLMEIAIVFGMTAEEE